MNELYGHLRRGFAALTSGTAGADALDMKAVRRRYCKAVQKQVRESLARVKSFGEIHLGLGGAPALARKSSIGGDGHATWDRAAWIDR